MNLMAFSRLILAFHFFIFSCFLALSLATFLPCFFFCSAALALAEASWRFLWNLALSSLILLFAFLSLSFSKMRGIFLISSSRMSWIFSLAEMTSLAIFALESPFFFNSLVFFTRAYVAFWIFSLRGEAAL